MLNDASSYHQCLVIIKFSSRQFSYRWRDFEISWVQRYVEESISVSAISHHYFFDATDIKTLVEAMFGQNMKKGSLSRHGGKISDTFPIYCMLYCILMKAYTVCSNSWNYQVQVFGKL